MPGQPTTQGANLMLDAVSGRATVTARTMYVALLTAAPTDTSTLATMTELTATGYSRQSVTFGAATGDPSVMANTNVLTFGAFSTDPANVTHLALVSAASGTTGDLTWYWTADAAKDAAIGDSISIAAGALTLSAD
jgi:hypothetical protein